MRKTITTLATLLALSLVACGGDEVECYDEGQDTICQVAVYPVTATKPRPIQPNPACLNCHNAPDVASTIKVSQAFDSYRHLLPQEHPVLIFKQMRVDL